MNALLVSSIVLSVFLSALVLVKQKKNYSHYLLAGWFLFTAVHLTILYLQTLNAASGYPYPWIIGIDLSMIVVHTILIFLYILSFIHPDHKKASALWHLFPVLGINMLLLKTSYLKGSSWKISSYEHALDGTGYIDQGLELSVLVIVCLSIGYLVAGFWLLYKHRQRVKKIYSTLSGVDLKWLNILLISVTGVIILNILIEWTKNYFSFMPSDLGINIGYVSILTGLIYVGFHGIRQTSIFSTDEPIFLGSSNSGETALIDENKDKEKNNIDDTLDIDYEKLIKFMELNKPYLDLDLNLHSLSKLIGFKPRYLSHIINQKAGRNFFDFINLYRIEEFKTRAKRPEYKNFTLLAIAYDCGFNSKATFNRVFKIHTGHTPSRYFDSI